MKPFEDYPQAGCELLGTIKVGRSVRRGCALEIQKITGQANCAYCGASLVDDYRHWLLTCVDRVISERDANRLGLPHEFCYDVINTVLCCSGCKSFGAGYSVPEEWREKRRSWRLRDFLELRDDVFLDRNRWIGDRRARERAFFEQRPWETELALWPAERRAA